jgi:hypothetical protein
MNYKMLSEELYNALRLAILPAVNAGTIDQELKQTCTNLFRQFEKAQKLSISTKSVEKLVQTAKKLTRVRDNLISLSGHSNEIETENYNQTLSEFSELANKFIAENVDTGYIKNLVKSELGRLIESQMAGIFNAKINKCLDTYDHTEAITQRLYETMESDAFLQLVREKNPTLHETLKKKSVKFPKKKSTPKPKK